MKYRLTKKNKIIKVSSWCCARPVHIKSSNISQQHRAIQRDQDEDCTPTFLAHLCSEWGTGQWSQNDSSLRRLCGSGSQISDWESRQSRRQNQSGRDLASEHGECIDCTEKHPSRLVSQWIYSFGGWLHTVGSVQVMTLFDNNQCCMLCVLEIPKNYYF